MTVLAIIEERLSGLCDRTIISGITTFQFFLSHALTQFVLLIFQVSIKILMCYVIFDTPLTGSIILVLLLTLLQGITGTIFGLMVSSIAHDLITAVTIGTAFLFPSLILSGSLWPLQYSPKWLKSISVLIPWTLPSEAMRNIMYRGWDLLNFNVYIGFISSFIWLIIFFIIGVFFIKRNM